MSSQKFRLVTRSDFDGLVCAVLLNELDLIDDIKFAQTQIRRFAEALSSCSQRPHHHLTSHPVTGHRLHLLLQTRSPTHRR